jgi:hypothetical protein
VTGGSAGRMALSAVPMSYQHLGIVCQADAPDGAPATLPFHRGLGGGEHGRRPGGRSFANACRNGVSGAASRPRAELVQSGHPENPQRAPLLGGRKRLSVSDAVRC